MKLPYAEGSVFSVPLRTRGYARGLLARMGVKGKAIFAYFFGPVYESVHDLTLSDLTPDCAILLARCGDLGLINREWTVLGQLDPWERKKWPMPAFVHGPRLSRGDNDENVVVRTYSEDNPVHLVSEKTVRRSSYTDSLPEDGMAGYGYIELKLTRLLS